MDYSCYFVWVGNFVSNVTEQCNLWVLRKIFEPNRVGSVGGIK